VAAVERAEAVSAEDVSAEAVNAVGRPVSATPRRPGAQRRAFVATGAALAAGACLPCLARAPTPAAASAPALASPPPPRLDREQTRVFREWMTLLVHAQIDRGPNPRWVHRDCAGLVRFAVDESLRTHDLAWRRANGFIGLRVPPDVALADDARARLRQSWLRADGTRGAFAPAIDLVQANTRFVARDLNAALPGDLLFFDVGDDQHLMVWMGRYIAYHTGRSDAADNGLRALRIEQLAAWSDTRWRPVADNPNFAGLYRLDFLAS
jgi:hypothetical protein